MLLRDCGIDPCAGPISSAWREGSDHRIHPNPDKIWGVWIYGQPKSGGILGILDVTSLPFLERSWGVWMGPIKGYAGGLPWDDSTVARYENKVACVRKH